MNQIHRDLETAAAIRRVKTEAVRPEDGVGSMARAFPEVERVLQAAGVAFLELNYDARAGHGEFTTVRCIGPDGKSMSWLLPAACARRCAARSKESSGVATPSGRRSRAPAGGSCGI